MFEYYSVVKLLMRNESKNEKKKFYNFFFFEVGSILDLDCAPLTDQEFFLLEKRKGLSKRTFVRTRKTVNFTCPG